jgi:hypothetical protein
MGPAEGSGAVAGRVARPGAGGVVSRPGLFDRLGASARVTVVSAPPGSGKTVLLRSWIGEAGLEDSAAWVPVGPGERDPQRFWLSVLGALRQTSAGSALVRAVTAAPDLDGWAIVERLLKDLAPLAETVWLVLDDVHELGSDEARRQLELLVMRAPDRCGSCWSPGMICSPPPWPARMRRGSGSGSTNGVSGGWSCGLSPVWWPCSAVTVRRPAGAACARPMPTPSGRIVRSVSGNLGQAPA